MRPQRIARRMAVVGLLAAVAGVFVLPAPRADAEVVAPGIAIEGWFARNRPSNPTAEIPCLPPPAPNPAGCGPVSPAPFPAPQSEATGAYVVSSAGGDSGRSDSSGDTGWAVFQWDLFEHIGATVNRFEVTFTQAPNNRGDAGTPVISACNIVVPFGAENGPNPWPGRPTIDCSSPVVPTVKADTKKYTFDLTEFAKTWIDGTGYGVAIVPGAPGKTTGLTPFQLTLAGYFSTAPNAASVVPVATFDYTSVSDELGDFAGGFLDEGFDDAGSTDFAADPGLDIIPTDVGSPPVSTAPPAGEVEVALPRTTPASSSGKLPLAILLFLPLAAVAFWGTGTALGPAGDPIQRRKGGVSRMLEHRRASDPPIDPRN